MTKLKKFLFLSAYLGLLVSPNASAAKDPVFAMPLDCTLGETCFIQNYVDTDPSKAAADFTCGTLAYDGHKGTDFALPLRSDIWLDHEVFAAAPGTVHSTRDGMPDFVQGTEGAPDVTGRECGNSVVVDHGGGWLTRYCHLRQGSVQVRSGQKVGGKSVLGLVGLSGQTQFPHVHMSIYKDGNVIDPFNPTQKIACGDVPSPEETLWKIPISYDAGGLIDIGIASAVPKYDDVKSGTAGRLRFTSSTPALVVFSFAFGGKLGDVTEISVTGPDGELFARDIISEKDQAQFMKAFGKKNKGLWRPGLYEAKVVMRRGDDILGEKSKEFIIVR